MKRSTRTALSALCLAGLALTGTGCGLLWGDDAAYDDAAYDGAAYEVTYEITGTGVDEIDFSGGKGTESVGSPGLPWRKTVTLRGAEPPSVSAALGERGEVTCKISYKGRMLKERTTKRGFDSAVCVAVSPAP